MLVMFVGTDRTETAVNASQVTFVSSVNDGTRIRFGEGRSVTVTVDVSAFFIFKEVCRSTARSTACVAPTPTVKTGTFSRPAASIGDVPEL